MAEGAIEGEAVMYELADPHTTAFPFSRFDATPSSVEVGEVHAAIAESAGARRPKDSPRSPRRRYAPPPTPQPHTPTSPPHAHHVATICL